MACELNIFSSGSPYGLLAQCSFIKCMVGCTIMTFLALYFAQNIDMWCLRWPFEIKPGKSDAVADTDSEREGVFWLPYLHALNTLLECSIQVQCSWKKRCDPPGGGVNVLYERTWMAGVAALVDLQLQDHGWPNEEHSLTVRMAGFISSGSGGYLRRMVAVYSVAWPSGGNEWQ